MTGQRFDHLTDGTPESSWPLARLTTLPRLPMCAPADHVVVLAAHPDDETLGAGGLIHQARRCGARVTVVVATDGERSHPASPTSTPASLAPRRRAELLAAIDALADGVTVRALGLPDGELTAYGPAVQAAVERLAADATVLVAPWAGDRHPDHAAVATVATDAGRRHGIPVWQYPIWMWHWADPASPDVPWEQLQVLQLSSADLGAKNAAVRAYRSQVEPLSDAPGDEAVVGAGMLAHFRRRVEAFVVLRPTTPAAAEPAYFEALYARSDDPWGLGSRFYEQRKRSLLMAALPKPLFGRTFEPGCATGLLTVALAARSDRLVAWDVAAAAVRQTRARVDAGGHGDRVRVETGQIPVAWPDGEFDLVVLSEVGYYSPDLDALVERAVTGLAPGGLIAACHWRHRAAEHPHGGDEVHEAFGRRLQTVVAHVEEDFLLHVWGADSRAVVSPARREGIVP